MNVLAPYVIKLIITSVLFYCYYLFALRNQSFNTYNRFYLLGTMLLSMITPLINFHWLFISEARNIKLNAFLLAISTGGLPESAFSNKSTWMLFGCSLAVSVVLLIILISKIAWIYRLKGRYKKIRMQGFNLFETSLDAAPFSFLDNLFWKNDMAFDDVIGQKTFNHEVTHIRERHTLDKLFMQFAVCIFWMNPVYWLMQKELNMVHEFIADANSIGKGDGESFAWMLLHSHNGGRYLDPAHLFFQSPVKRRLLMITTMLQTNFSFERRLLALPVAVLVSVIFSFTVLHPQSITNWQQREKEQKLIDEKKAGTTVGLKLPDYYNDNFKAKKEN